MTQHKSATGHPVESRPAADLVSVSRAVADLRRGEIVLVEGDQGCVAVIATEPLSDQGLVRLRLLAKEAGSSEESLAIVLPRVRARFLGHAGIGSGFVAFCPETPAVPDAETCGALANPLFDDAVLPPGGWRATSGAEDAAIRLAKLARLLPAVIAMPLGCCDAAGIAVRENLLWLDAAGINGYEDASAGSLRAVSEARVPLENAENARIIAFRPEDGGQEHLAIVIDEPQAGEDAEPVLVRLHSECFTGDLIGSLRCDCGPQLRGAIAEIAKSGKGGIILYLRQEGRGIGLVNKLRAYALQDRGFDTLDANEELGFDADERVYRPAAEMLRQLGFGTVRLLTNNPEKLAGLEKWGVVVRERVAHAFPSNGHNAFYLQTKKDRAGHLF